MKKNMGSADRIIRMAVAAIVLALYFTHQISGTWAIIGLVVLVIFILTGFMSFCPLYFPFGISTAKKNNKTYNA